MWWIANGDSRDVLRAMADASVDSVVCDPPYEIGFMGRKWDASGIAYDVSLWAEVLRVLKPGGHLLAFGGTRTYHRMVCAIEDAGFEVRDSIHWITGSGFPKSLDVSKAIDKAAGAEREVIGSRKLTGTARIIGGQGGATSGRASEMYATHETRETLCITAPATEAAREWSGWGTALKPAHEPIVVARKPLDGTVAANVLAHGTGAINVDGCRVKHASTADLDASKAKNPGRADLVSSDVYGAGRPQQSINESGRWPPNIILSHAPECGDECADGCAVAEMDGQSGGASRFFPAFRYQAKASKSDRGEGNTHNTVKPTDLMRWLVRLVTQPSGLVLDPFTGSGSTGVAAVAEGFRFAGIELSQEYAEIARARVAHSESTRPTTLPGLGVV